MIKNDTQLAQARAKLQELQADLDELVAQYREATPSYLVVPLERDMQHLRREIGEYEMLRRMSLQEAVRGPLARPVPLEKVGELLAKLRIAAGITQEGLADKLGWEQSNLSRFESATNGSQTIRKISEYLDGLGIWLHVRPSFVETGRPITEAEEKTLSNWGALATRLRDIEITLRSIDVRAEVTATGETTASDSETQPILADGWPGQSLEPTSSILQATDVKVE